MTLVVANIMRAKLKRRHLSSPMPMTSCELPALCLPFSSIAGGKKNKEMHGKVLVWKLQNTLQAPCFSYILQ